MVFLAVYNKLRLELGKRQRHCRKMFGAVRQEEGSRSSAVVVPNWHECFLGQVRTKVPSGWGKIFSIQVRVLCRLAR